MFGVEGIIGGAIGVGGALTPPSIDLLDIRGLTRGGGVWEGRQDSIAHPREDSNQLHRRVGER